MAVAHNLGADLDQLLADSVEKPRRLGGLGWNHSDFTVVDAICGEAVAELIEQRESRFVGVACRGEDESGVSNRGTDRAS